MLYNIVLVRNDFGFSTMGLGTLDSKKRDDLLLAAFIVLCDNSGDVSDVVGRVSQYNVNLIELNTETTNLDLVVSATDELESTIGKHANVVSSTVYPAKLGIHKAGSSEL